MVVVEAILITAAGILMATNPELIYTIREKWKSYSDSEPSKLYINSIRFLGIMLIIIAVLALVVTFMDTHNLL